MEETTIREKGSGHLLKGQVCKTNKLFVEKHGHYVYGTVIGFKILDPGDVWARETVVLRDVEGKEHQVNESWLEVVE